MVKQTAGHDALGTFAPKFAELNDDVLFGEVWSREKQLSLRDRSIVTVTALMAQGLDRQLFQIPSGNGKKEWRYWRGNGGNFNSCCILCRVAKSMGCV